MPYISYFIISVRFTVDQIVAFFEGKIFLFRT